MKVNLGLLEVHLARLGYITMSGGKVSGAILRVFWGRSDATPDGWRNDLSFIVSHEVQETAAGTDSRQQPLEK